MSLLLDSMKLSELIKELRDERDKLVETHEHSLKYPKTVSVSEYGYGTLDTLERVIDKLVELNDLS